MIADIYKAAYGWVKATRSHPILLLHSDGTFNWLMNPQSVATLSYKAGFPLYALTVIGTK